MHGFAGHQVASHGPMARWNFLRVPFRTFGQETRPSRCVAFVCKLCFFLRIWAHADKELGPNGIIFSLTFSFFEYAH